MKISPALLSQVIKKRPTNSHKGTFGRSVLIGGDQHYGGAILMAAEACINSGSGLTTVITDLKNHSPLHARLPEAMVVDFTENTVIEDSLASADVILIGPGLGLSNESLDLLQLVLKRQQPQQWLVIDGSAITLFAQHHLTLNFPKQTVFTPHQMEWQRLSGLPIAEQNLETSQKARDQLGALIVAKSQHTVLYSDQAPLENPLGNPAMATGGTGDTLAGMITGFLAQFTRAPQTVAAAVYLHSLIADELAKTAYVVLPTHISQALPLYLKRFADEPKKTDEGAKDDYLD